MNFDKKCLLITGGTGSFGNAVLRQTIILTWFEPQVVLDSVRLVIDEHKKGSYTHIAEDYLITNTSWRTLKLIMGNASLSNLWDGIRK